MKTKFFGLGLLLLVFSVMVKAQVQNPSKLVVADTAKINALLQASKGKVNEHPDLAMSMAYEAKDMSQKAGYPRGIATALKNIGIAYYSQGNPEAALEKWQEALRIFETAKDDMGVVDLLGNIGIFHYNRGNESKALEYYLRSLKIAESSNYKKGIVIALNNIGGVYYNKEATHDKALTYYLHALPLCKELGDQNILGAISVNVGSIYLKKDDEVKALAYLNEALKAYSANPANIPNVYNALGALYLQQQNSEKALKNYKLGLEYATKTNGKLNTVRSLTGIAKVYSAEGMYAQAITYFNRAESLATEIGAALEYEDLYGQMALAYQKTGDYKNAFKYQSLFSNAKEALYNTETDKRVATLQFDFDLEKKQNQINLLTKDSSIKELQLKKQEAFKNAMAIVLALIVIVVFVLYRSYRIKAKTNKILDKKNMEIESLLLNILPAEVVTELQATGKATPHNYESVSVMFTDFKDFTSLTNKMSPEALVEELSDCFMAFDHIIEKNGLERIKTIGDAYMCAGGVPTPNPDHIFNMVKASLEIQKYISLTNQKRVEKGLPAWEIRIGIHVGPVVAGVVGNKKYAYDIWGSTVNIASRMESSGMAGNVNISSAVYEKISEKYACTYRGKIYAKNIGEIDMYLIDLEIAKSSHFLNLEEIPEKGKVSWPVIMPGNLLQ